MGGQKEEKHSWEFLDACGGAFRDRKEQLNDFFDFLYILCTT
jgi:hypothetical protein